LNSTVILYLLRACFEPKHLELANAEQTGLMILIDNRIEIFLLAPQKCNSKIAATPSNTLVMSKKVQKFEILEFGR
jgi:hypothetical protein